MMKEMTHISRLRNKLHTMKQQFERLVFIMLMDL